MAAEKYQRTVGYPSTSWASCRSIWRDVKQLQRSFISGSGAQQHIDCVIALQQWTSWWWVIRPGLTLEGRDEGRVVRQVMPRLLASGNTCAQLSYQQGLVRTLEMGNLQIENRFDTISLKVVKVELNRTLYSHFNISCTFEAFYIYI